MFTVEHIHSQRSYRRNDGKVVYRVKWEGYEEETWEPIRNFFTRKTYNVEMFKIIMDYQRTAERAPDAKRLCLTCCERVYHGNLFCDARRCTKVQRRVYNISRLMK